MLEKCKNKYAFIFLILLTWMQGSLCEQCMRTSRLDPRIPNITIGFLSSFNFMDSVGKLIAGALPLAVEVVNNRSDLLPDHNLQYIAAHSGRPDTCEAMRRMSEMRDEGVIAFIGPDNSCASEAKLAAAWSYPMIAYVSTFFFKFYFSLYLGLYLSLYLSLYCSPVSNSSTIF